eukprot:SAG31_NODE_3885_length_3786_cov_2.016554_2_plen_74_part_00
MACYQDTFLVWVRSDCRLLQDAAVLGVEVGGEVMAESARVQAEPVEPVELAMAESARVQVEPVELAMAAMERG